MSIVRVTWTDALGGMVNVWSTLDDIIQCLDDTSVVTVGHLVEGHDAPYVVVAASKTGDDYGGVFAIPTEMITSIQILESDHPPSTDPLGV